MRIKLGDNTMFHCPQGGWSGVCEKISTEPEQGSQRSCERQVRLYFRVDTNEGEKLVAKTFCEDLRVGSDLYRFMDSWWDGDFERFLDEDGNVDWQRFVGRRADLVITHGLPRDHYSYPFVNIAGIHPAGTLELD